MRVVVTRPRKQADSLATALQARGFEPIFFSTVQIAPVADPGPLNAALNRQADFDWMVFTSANAVDAVWKQLERLGIAFQSSARVAAVGRKTAARLETHGVIPDSVPERFLAEAIVPGLGDLQGKRVLLPLADLAPDNLPKAIVAAGGIPVAVPAYRTLPAKTNREGLAALRSGVEVVTFTSGSTARNFAMLVRQAGLNPLRLPADPLIACIGPKTAAAAREIGFRVDVVAEEYTIEGLAQALSAQAKPIQRWTRSHA